MIYQISETSWVRFSLPIDWEERIGDVCLYPDRGMICFVDRSMPGYLTIDVHPANCDGGPVELHEDEAQALCNVFNRENLQVTSLDVDDIVASSMALPAPNAAGVVS